MGGDDAPPPLTSNFPTTKINRRKEKSENSRLEDIWYSCTRDDIPWEKLEEGEEAAPGQSIIDL